MRWWSHVSALANDDLQGRDTGSDGHRKAAAYVAGEFERCGLRPAGTDGYLQPIGLRISWIDEEHSRLTLAGPDGERSLTLGEDASISLRVDPAASVEADLVFAGYGLTIPEADYDDFRDLDVKGKVVVYLGGAPPEVAGPLAAHMQSTAERAETLRRAGAIGFISIVNPKIVDIPWSRLKLSRLMPSMRPADPAMDETRGLQIAITANPAQADKILAGSGHTTREILDAADGGKPLPHFAIPSRLKAKVAVRRAEGESQNVLGLLPGSDPELKRETVVFTAHLDHLGVGEPIGGDLIYNGAMDNAAGVAALLDVAASLKEAGAKPRRSILFAAVTGEEKGLLGSRVLANHPTVDPRGLVADINTDMFLPLYPMKRLTVYGINESDLGEDAVAVARSLGVAPQDDPEPKAQQLHPQRSIQLHPARYPGAGPEDRL